MAKKITTKTKLIFFARLNLAVTFSTPLNKASQPKANSTAYTKEVNIENLVNGNLIASLNKGT